MKHNSVLYITSQQKDHRRYNVVITAPEIKFSQGLKPLVSIC